MNKKSLLCLIAGFFMGSLFTIGCGGGGGGGNGLPPVLYSASDVIFENQVCTLASSNVQSAIDELLVKQQTEEAVQGAQAMATTTSTLTGAINELVARAAQLEAQLTALETKTASMSTSGTDVYFTGVNIHIRNNGGSSKSRNGTGNLVIGYDEGYYATPAENEMFPHKYGSHCLIIGPKHFYVGYLGIAVGEQHLLWEDCSYALGGQLHQLYGGHGTICGGCGNRVNGDGCSVSGGAANFASGSNSVVSGSASKGTGDNASHVY